MVRDLLSLRVFSIQATSRIDMSAHTFYRTSLAAILKAQMHILLQ